MKYSIPTFILFTAIAFAHQTWAGDDLSRMTLLWVGLGAAIFGDVIASVKK